MNTGDLVKFKNNGMIGVVMKLVLDHLGDKMYIISWMDGHRGTRWADELEVINASR